MKEAIDEEIVKLFFDCNFLFNVIEHKLVTNLIKILRPGYKPPIRKALSEEYLNSMSSELQHKIKDVLDRKVVTLVEDGWSNMHNEHLMGRYVVSDGKAYYLDVDE